ncbi:hypothetical protein GC177_00025 [bacterium]|nr:hypothetical protein [bacterium]
MNPAIQRHKAASVLSAFTWDISGIGEENLRPRESAMDPDVQASLLRNGPLRIKGTIQMEDLWRACRAKGVYVPILDEYTTKDQILGVLQDILSMAGIPWPMDAYTIILSDKEWRAALKQVPAQRDWGPLQGGGTRFSHNEDGNLTPYPIPSVIWHDDGSILLEISGLDVALLAGLGVKPLPSADAYNAIPESWRGI